LSAILEAPEAEAGAGIETGGHAAQDNQFVTFSVGN